MTLRDAISAAMRREAFIALRSPNGYVECPLGEEDLLVNPSGEVTATGPHRGVKPLRLHHMEIEMEDLG